MNNGFSDALVQRIDGRQHAFHASSGTLYLPYEVVHCMPSNDGWVEDPDQPADPSPFASEGTPFAVPVVPLADAAPPKTRLRVVPVPGDRGDYLLVLDRADDKLAAEMADQPSERADVRLTLLGCAGVLVLTSEVEVE